MPSFATIEIHTSPWEAHVSRALLASEGIPAVLTAEHHVAVQWPLSHALGGVRLLVPVEHVATARSLFAQRDAGAL